MPLYTCRILTEDATVEVRYRRARHLGDVHAQVSADGQTLIQAKIYRGSQVQKGDAPPSWRQRMHLLWSRLLAGIKCPLTPGEWSDLFGYLALFEQSGISMQDGLETLLATFERPIQKGVIVALLEGLERGQKLSVTMRDVSSPHQSLIIGFLRAGEQDGRIAPYCLKLQDFFQKHDHFIQKRRRALMYPILVLVLTVLLLGLLLFVVVPQFEHFWQWEPIQGNGKGRPPWSTQLLLKISAEPFLFTAFFLGVPLLFGLVLGVGCGLSRSFARRIRRLFRIVPVVRLHDDLALSLCFGVVGVLLNAGLDLKQALIDGGYVLKSRYLGDAYHTWCRRIQGGGGVAQSMTLWPHLSPIVYRFMQASEISGHLGDGFERCAHHLKERAERGIDLYLDLLHPALLIVMGGILAWIATAFFLPLYDHLSAFEGAL